MGKDWLNTPRHAASVSVAYPQGRTWSARARSMAVQLLLIVLVVWFAVTGLTAVGLHFRPHEPSTKYVLVIDSGSSGTRIYAYSWVLPSKRSAPGSLPLIKAIPPETAAQLIPKKEKKGLYNRVETQPGLDAFVGDPAGLEATALQPLLAWACAVVPANQHAATPLFMLGTGGLRGMELHARKALMSDIRRILAVSGFRFHETWAKVISGTDEGVYGWLALNYEKGLLAQQQAAGPAASLGRRSGSTVATATPIALSLPSSLGSLDMGGSSLELTFEVRPGSTGSTYSPAAAASNTGLQNVTINDHTFYLHTHTFHRYGLNEAYDRSVTLLLEQQRKGEEQAATHQGNKNQEEQQEKLMQPGISQAQQQEQQAGSADLPRSSALQPGTAAAAPGPAASAYDGGDAVARVSLPALSASAELAQQHVHVDLAVAAAAGLRPDEGPAAHAGNSSSSSSGNSTSNSALERAQQQMQTDLAVAAAAGFKPELPTTAGVAAGSAAASAAPCSASHVHSPDMMQQHIQADLAVAAAAGLLPQHDHKADIDATATSKSVAGSGESSSSSSSMAVSSSIEHVDTATSNVAALAASRVDAAAAAAPQPGSSSKTHSDKDHNSRGGETSQHLASKHYDGALSQHRALHFQHRRQRQRQQRQLLLLQHKYLEPVEAMDLDTFFSTQEHASAAITSTSSVLASATRQPWIQQASSHLLHQLRHLLDDTVASALPPSLIHSDGQGSTDHTIDRGTDISTHTFAAAPEPLTAFSSSGSHTGSNHGGPVSALPHHGSIQAPVLQGSQGYPEHVAAAEEGSTTAGVPDVWHPCLHDGYAAEYERLAHGGVVPHPSQVLLRGRPDWSACLQLVDKVVNASAPCQVSQHRPHCRLGSAQPELQGSFVALTGFYVVWKFLQVSPDAPVGALLDASRDLCSQPWTWVHQHLGHNINVERYCTWGPYTVRLLRQGLHLQDKDVLIGSGDVGWPLGAALAEASKIPEMMGKPSASNARHAWHAGADTPSSSTIAETGSGHGNPSHGTFTEQPGGTITAHVSSVAKHDHVGQDSHVQQLGGEHAWTSTATAGGASIGSDFAKQQQQLHGFVGEAYTENQPGPGGSESTTGSHMGAWQFSQRRSWAQAIFGSRRHTPMVHILWVLLFLVVWLSLVVYCLPHRGVLSGHISGPNLFFLPVAFRGLHGPGKAQHILPLVGYSVQGCQSGRRNIPSPARGSTTKYTGGVI